MKKKRFPRNLKFAGEFIRFEFRLWLDDGTVSTLGDLHKKLEEVQDEMMNFDGDALILDHWDELGTAANYISQWGDPSEREDDPDDPHTFDYRLANVEEDLMYVEELIEGLGESYKIGDLPMPKYGQQKPTAA